MNNAPAVTSISTQYSNSGQLPYAFVKITEYAASGQAGVLSVTTQSVTFCNPSGGNGGSGSAHALYRYGNLEYTKSESIMVYRHSTGSISFPDIIYLPGIAWVDE
jgi:hypothetical protein